jgi:hypothetical protein
MSVFQLYFRLGIEHILDLNGYDHILFIITLCAVYLASEWKKVLIIVTAFTLGHSLTLALATLEMVSVSSSLIEFLIPLTIFLTALFNIVTTGRSSGKLLHTVKYVAALFFGLIHGLGFSNYLRSLLGSESRIFTPLLGFNLGVEVGQVALVLVIFLFTWVTVSLLHAKKREWDLVLSGAGLGVSLIMIIERFPA